MPEEIMTWHASLLQSLLERQQHPDMTTARRLSNLDEKQWRAERQQRKWEAKQGVRQGKILAEQRDEYKRKIKHMSTGEQEVLKEFGTKKLKKQHEQECVKKLPRFTGKMLYH